MSGLAQRANSLGPTWIIYDLCLCAWYKTAACCFTYAASRHGNCADHNARL